MGVSSHWAFKAAEALARRTAGRTTVIETGYGPTGLPHVGTVAEVLRSALVIRAFREIAPASPVRFLSVTDDMDGLRRIPSTVPVEAGMEQYLGAPLRLVPNPWGSGGFAAHNAALLRGHLRRFGLTTVDPADSLRRLLNGDGTAPDEILCIMASDLYLGGHLDYVLSRVAGRAQDIARVVLPELREARRRTWCPFVPIRDGLALTEIDDWRIEDDEIEWSTPTGERVRSSVLGGACKLQWRVDWSARWVALGVDFEMHGKDLSDSVRLGALIAPMLGGRAPQTLRYELFLDEDGAKMSKSVGNGVGVADWERHAPTSAFLHFLSRDPERARKVGLDTIPRAVDDWITALRAGSTDNPTLHLIHPQGLPPVRSRLGFSTILGITELADADDPDIVLRLLEGYDPAGIDKDDPLLAELVRKAVARHLDVGRPIRTYIVPTETEAEALLDLARSLRACPRDADAEAVQSHAYEAGKRHGGPEGLRDFFRLVYRTLLGRDSGPRLGTLAEAVGVDYLVDRLIERTEGANRGIIVPS